MPPKVSRTIQKNPPIELRHLSSFSPGEIRALLWVSDQHPHCTLDVCKVRDGSSVGLLFVRTRYTGRGGGDVVASYFLSPTGRVFRAEPSWNNPNYYHRTDHVLREADYEEHR